MRFSPLPRIPGLLLVTGLFVLTAPMWPSLVAAQSMQTMRAVQEGDTVRFLIRDSDRPLEGRVVEATRDGFRVDVDGEVREVEALSLRGLEVRSGTRGTAGKGALIGLAAGTSIGLLIALDADGEGFVSESDLALGIGVPLFALTGTLVGALIGTMNRVDRWVAVTPVIGSAAGATGTGLALTWSF